MNLDYTLKIKLDACGVISKEEYEYQTGLKGEQP